MILETEIFKILGIILIIGLLLLFALFLITYSHKRHEQSKQDTYNPNQYFITYYISKIWYWGLNTIHNTCDMFPFIYSVIVIIKNNIHSPYQQTKADQTANIISDKPLHALDSNTPKEDKTTKTELYQQIWETIVLSLL
jgi:hypothetical protein